MNPIRVLFLVHHPIDDGSSRYRVYQFLPLLERSGFDCEVRPFSTPRLFKAIREGGSLAAKLLPTLSCTFRRALDIRQAADFDLVVIHREAFPFFAPFAERMVLRRQPKVVFGLDDAIYVGHDRKIHHYSWLYKFKYGSGLNEILERSQLVMAGSQVIAEHVLQYNRNVVVIPTVVDLDKCPYKLPEERLDGILTVGWYGSDSTSPYLRHILPGLLRLADANPGRVRFRFFGDRRLDLPLPSTEVLPFRLEAEIQDLQSIDIGIMPIPDTEWTRAKCAFKAIQYMALGIPSVVSPIGMSADLVRNGANGLYASSAEEWFSQLHRLVNDIHLRRKLAIAGRRTIEDHYSLQKWGPCFADCLRAVHEDRVASLNLARILTISKAAVAREAH
jgi:glycosyltransferase involved in cell wall biosynthesis